MDDSNEEVRVNFRWTREHVAVIKRAAALAGVPYQSWLKMVAFRAAVKDIQDAAKMEGYLASGTGDVNSDSAEDADEVERALKMYHDISDDVEAIDPRAVSTASIAERLKDEIVALSYECGSHDDALKYINDIVDDLGCTYIEATTALRLYYTGNGPR